MYGLFHVRRTAFSTHLKTKVGSTLTKGGTGFIRIYIQDGFIFKKNWNQKLVKVCLFEAQILGVKHENRRQKITSGTEGRRNFITYRNYRITTPQSSITFYKIRKTNMTTGTKLCTFRCLHGHVCQRSCGVVCHEVWNMVKNFQVTIDHVHVCDIHTMGLTTLLCNERSSRCNHN